MTLRTFPLAAIASSLVLGAAAAVSAGQAVPATPPPAAAQPSARAPVTALMVEVAIARYQGDKRVSNMPFTLAVNTDNSRSSLRMGGDVPVPATTFAPAADSKDAKPAETTMSYSYRSLGTNIDVNAVPADEGRYKLVLLVEDSSVYAEVDAKQLGVMRGVPSFRSFRTNNSLTMRNGQTVEFTAATDRISGEVVKVSVKMTVLN